MVLWLLFFFVMNNIGDIKKYIAIINRFYYILYNDVIDSNPYFSFKDDYFSDCEDIETEFIKIIKQFDKKEFYIKLQSFPKQVFDYYNIVVKNIERIDLIYLEVF